MFLRWPALRVHQDVPILLNEAGEEDSVMDPELPVDLIESRSKLLDPVLAAVRLTASAYGFSFNFVLDHLISDLPANREKDTNRIGL